MANQYQSTHNPRVNPPVINQSDEDQTNAAIAVAIIALLVITGVAYAYYYKVHTSEVITVSTTENTASSSVVSNMDTSNVPVTDSFIDTAAVSGNTSSNNTPSITPGY